VYASLDATLAWKRAAAPIGTHKSATEEPLKLDYTEAVSTVELGPTEEFTPLPPQTVDARLASGLANLRSMVWQSTVARVLQSLDFPGGSAFSSNDLALSAAISSLSPYKTISEQTISDVMHLMLCWVRYYSDEYKEGDLYGEYYGKQAGKVARIPGNTIAPEAVRLEVIMTPDVPLDEQAKANTAVLLHREFKLPQSALVEDMGYDNPKEMFEMRAQEDLDNSLIDVELQRPLRDLEMQYQQMMMEMQAGIQQQMQEQQMAQEQQAQQGAQPITENLGGLGGNPAAGGTPPIQGAPGQGL